MISIYVISNGDLFQGAFNAVATLVNDRLFRTVFDLGMVFATLGVGYTYTQTHDLKTFFKWFAIYFLAINILFGNKWQTI